MQYAFLYTNYCVLYDCCYFPRMHFSAHEKDKLRVRVCARQQVQCRQSWAVREVSVGSCVTYRLIDAFPVNLCDGSLSHYHSTGDMAACAMPRHFRCCWRTVHTGTVSRLESGENGDAFSDRRLRDTITRQGTCASRAFSLVLVTVDDNFVTAITILSF